MGVDLCMNLCAQVKDSSAITRQGERPLATHMTGGFLLVSGNLIRTLKKS